MKTEDATFIPANNANFQYVGRFDTTMPEKMRFAFPGTTIKTKFTGNKLTLLIKDFAVEETDRDDGINSNFLNVIVDGVNQVIRLKGNEIHYPVHIEKNLDQHTLEIVKRTEGFVGFCEFQGILLDVGAEILPAEKNKRKIIFIGDSITCGYGNEETYPYAPFTCATENASLAYPCISAQHLTADAHLIACSGRGVAQNFDETAHNTLPKIYNRIYPDSPDHSWDSTLFTPDLISINLGTNDFYGGVDLIKFTDAYLQFIQDLAKVYPMAKFLIVLGPMLNDRLPENSLRICRVMLEDIILQLKARGYLNVELFEISEQTGELGYGGNMHPSVAQHKKNAEELTQFLRHYMSW